MNHILGHMQVCQNCSARSRCKRADIRQFPSQPCGKYTGRPGLAARRERVAFDANDVFETRLPVLTWARPTPHLSDDSRCRWIARPSSQCLFNMWVCGVDVRLKLKVANGLNPGEPQARGRRNLICAIPDLHPAVCFRSGASCTYTEFGRFIRLHRL